MKNLALTTEYYGKKQGISIDLTKDVIVMDVGQGPYISQWNPLWCEYVLDFYHFIIFYVV